MKKLPVTKKKTTVKLSAAEIAKAQACELSARRHVDLPVPQQELFKPNFPPLENFSLAQWLRSLTEEEIISQFLSEDEEGMVRLSFEAILHQLDSHRQFGSFDLPRLEADVLESKRAHSRAWQTEGKATAT